MPEALADGGAAEQGGRIGLKDAIQPIVAYARVDDARHHIDQTRTLDRIDSLTERGLLPKGRVRRAPMRTTSSWACA